MCSPDPLARLRGLLLRGGQGEEGREEMGEDGRRSEGKGRWMERGRVQFSTPSVLF